LPGCSLEVRSISWGLCHLTSSSSAPSGSSPFSSSLFSSAHLSFSASSASIYPSLTITAPTECLLEPDRVLARVLVPANLVAGGKIAVTGTSSCSVSTHYSRYSQPNNADRQGLWDPLFSIKAHQHPALGHPDLTISQSNNAANRPLVLISKALKFSPLFLLCTFRLYLSNGHHSYFETDHSLYSI
jgi:hypothetical protein